MMRFVKKTQFFIIPYLQWFFHFLGQIFPLFLNRMQTFQMKWHIPIFSKLILDVLIFILFLLKHHIYPSQKVNIPVKGIYSQFKNHCSTIIQRIGVQWWTRVYIKRKQCVISAFSVLKKKNIITWKCKPVSKADFG